MTMEPGDQASTDDAGHQPVDPTHLAAPAPPAVTAPPSPPAERYPVSFDVQYPERMSRLSTFFRGFLVIPLAFVFGLLQYFIGTAFLIGWMTVFWRRKYPVWLFNGLSGAFDYTARGWSYGFLLTDQFPSFSREQSLVSLDFDQPPSGYLSRWRVLFWKWFLLIPHFIVLNFLLLAVMVVTVIAWFAILFTGNYPRGMFQFSVGVQRWYHRVVAYFASFNDRFPPFALSAEAGPASRSTSVASGVGGWLLGGGYVAGLIALAAVGAKVKTEDVDYARLSEGRSGPTVEWEPAFADGPVSLRLNRAYDPGDDLALVLTPLRDERLIVFQWTIQNESGTAASIVLDAARLKYRYQGDDGEETRTVTAKILVVANTTAPVRVDTVLPVPINAVFVVPLDAEPLELRFSGGFAGGGVKYVFD